MDTHIREGISLNANSLHADSKASEMLPAIVSILRERGPQGFFLGTIAEEMGTSSRMLIYHFGSRDELLGRAMRVVREETIQYLNDPPPSTLLEAVDKWWDYYMVNLSDMQLFFHLASRRFEEPGRFTEFASNAVDSWVEYFASSIEAEGRSPEFARVLGRLTIAAMRGLTVDFLITGDKDHVDSSLDAFRSLLVAEMTKGRKR
ncbi:MAG: TetR/AcrR family transcriptional regulator [Pseudonocardiales bacterium]|nr:TetR/AcrR family transcriptional regulator [Pseudonocardiales bacterium]